MGLRDELPSQACLMLAAALQELRRSEAETDLARIRNLITNVEATLVELSEVAQRALEDGS